MKIDTTVLSNGIRVVTDVMPELETAALGVFVGAGSRHEGEDEQGLSHLLEHMAFKGTRRRSARQIAEEIETAGGELNAATSVDQTAYYARVLPGDAELALDILSDILTDSLFDDAELVREKNVILQEIGALEDAPEELVFDLFSAAAFPGQPIGRQILGTPAAVSHFDRVSIANYLARHYAAPATIIAAAGSVDHERVVEAVARRFRGMSAECAPAPPRARYIGGQALVRRKLEQTHLVVGFEGVSFHDKSAYAAQVFANAVGGGMSSRLFQEVREKRGLAYSIYSFHWAFADTGLFGFYAGASGADIGDALAASLDCLAEAAEAISEAEVLRAKAQMKVSHLAALESSSARSEQIARQLAFFDRVIPRGEIVERIDALSVEEIREAGALMLRSAPTIAAIGSLSRIQGSAQVMARVGRS